MTANIRDDADLRHWLVDYLATTIGCHPDHIDPDLPLNDLGVGSRDAVVLLGELSELLGRQISPVDFWEHPTVNALTAFLLAPESEPDVDVKPPSPGNSLDEQIAVVGLGCRFPGGIAGPDSLWQFLSRGGSAIGEVPPRRWQVFDDGSPEVARALARTTRWGSFLSEIDAFDAEFFDISPSEAAKMDPQQRLLLEVAYEALDHAGIPAQSLRRTQTGVFVGACLSEYGFLAFSDLGQIDAWTGTGSALSIIANRLSYCLDLRGPSVAVDTACSSSLVAVHLACQSLRTADSDLALAAGVNLLLSPAITRSFDAAEVMSPTGRCHTFDASADGYTRAEGCGVVVLKRLSDAVRGGDRVLAVVRGSAVNQDGRSNGLMAPNPAAQVAVLRAACGHAGVEPVDVDYVETHGTGTLLGDPIEARALGTVFGRGRPDNSPLLIGSVKTNLGHLEAAAGIAGFIKATLALQHAHIPQNLHFEAPNPHIPFDDMRMKVVAEPTNWPSTGRPRRAAVSSFGFGGTNAHVVLEQGPDHGPAEHPGSAVTTLVVSGKTPERVSSWAGVLADWMAGAGADVALGDVAHTLNHHRTRHGLFATVCARDRAQAVAGLRAVAAGQPAPAVVGPHQGACGPGTVFVYSGHGSQWAGMGRQLLADEPAFAAAVDELEPLFCAQVGFSLRQVLAGADPVVGVERIQPVLVGMQLALTALWRSYGVEPDAVIGHSMGEVTAAVVAQALSPAQGLRVIATRSQLMARLSGQGAMALLELDPHAAQALVAEHPDLTLAVYASPRQSVIAGPPEQIHHLIATVTAQDRLARLIDVDVASHHPLIDPLLPELRSALADLTPAAPVTPIITTTEEREGAPVFDAEHWAANLRNPVRLTQAVATAAENHTTFIEVSPHPILTHAITESLAGHHHVIATLHQDADEILTFHTNLNTTHTTQPPHTEHPSEPHPTIPTTPWHRSRHWLPTRAKRSGAAPKAGTLLGEHVPVSLTPPAHLWQARLVPDAKPYPGSHRIGGVDVVPLSVLLQTILAAAAEFGITTLSDIRFEHPIIIDQARAIQVVADHQSISVTSSSAADAPAQRWIRHVSASLSPSPTELDTLSYQDPNGIDIDHSAPSIAELLASWGIEGPPFSWSIDSCTRTSTGLVAEVGLAAASTVALVDAAVHLALLVGGTSGGLCVPAAVGQVRMESTLTDQRGSVSIRRTAVADGEFVVDITVTATDGSPCLSMHALRFTTLDSRRAQSSPNDGDPRTFAHTIEWRPRDRTDGQVAASGSIAVIGTDGDANEVVRKRLCDIGYSSASATDARYVIYVADARPTAETDLDSAVRMCSDVTNLVRLLAERDDDDPVSLWLITRGVHDAVHSAALRQSCLWGLAGVIAVEHPHLWGGLVDTEFDRDTGESISALASTLARPSTSIMVLRDGAFLVPALAPVTGEPVRGALQCRADAAYLITGGMGTLGLLMAAWLADRGARRLILAGRILLPPRRDWDRAIASPDALEKITAIKELEMRGVSVDMVGLDVGSLQSVRTVMARRDRDGAPPIRGIIHAAGVTNNELLTMTSDGTMREVMWPKIGGAQVLHEVFPPGSLDFFFLTGSAATIFGIPGQGSYAAANAYLDALARARNRDGCHTLSLDWVAWRGLGFAADAQIVSQELERLGSRPITPQEAFTAWEHVNSYNVAQAVMVPVQTSGVEDRSTISAKPARDWSNIPAEDLRNELQDGIRAILASELRMPETELDPDRPFAELGLNSITAMAVRREAEQLLGIELSATMLWIHPTISALAAHLAERLAGHDVPDVSSESAGNVLDALFNTIQSAPAASESGVR
jgi:phthiocerol/phenolphthiocerol synthesis type-I polyketide synthase A